MLVSENWFLVVLRRSKLMLAFLRLPVEYEHSRSRTPYGCFCNLPIMGEKGRLWSLRECIKCYEKLVSLRGISFLSPSEWTNATQQNPIIALG